MKRMLVVVVLLMATVTVWAAQDYMWIDRVEEEGRLLVPLRGIFEAYGAEVGWENATRTVTIEAPALSIRMTIDHRAAVHNGETRMLDVPPRVMNGRTYIPLRFAAEALGERVTYKGDRVELPTIGLTLLIRGEAIGPDVAPSPVGAVRITQPTEGARIGPRVEVRGTAPPGAFIVIETDVRTQSDNELLKTVPGIRHTVPPSGNWHYAIAAPTLPSNITEPLYYVIRAYTSNGRTSEPATVRVYRAD